MEERFNTWAEAQIENPGSTDFGMTPDGKIIVIDQFGAFYAEYSPSWGIQLTDPVNSFVAYSGYLVFESYAFWCGYVEAMHDHIDMVLTAIERGAYCDGDVMPS